MVTDIESSLEPTGSTPYRENNHGDVLLDTGLKAGLKNRMINLIALCGVIGPGALIGMGNMLKNGPVGCVVGFAIVALVVIPMLFAIGELNSVIDQNFALQGSRFVSKGFGATIGIFYVILWVTTLISEYTSLTASMESYTTKIPTYGWYLILWFCFTLFQLLDVSWWGEAEYILGFFKLAFITGFYIFAIIYAAGGIKGHKPDNPFGNYPLHSGFKGIANSFVYAGQFYAGVEGISIIAAESRNPKKAIPTATKNTLFRIVYVYVGLSVTYGITVPYNDPTLNSATGALASPITIAITEAGWKNAKYFVATMILMTCISSINTAIYFSSRTLFTWSQAGYGPKIFTKTTKRGIPYIAIHTCHIFGFLSILSYTSGSAVAYKYIINVSSVAAFIVWVAICVVHVRFRYGWISQGYSLESLPFRSPLFPWADYLGIIIGVLLVLVQSWSCFKPFDYKTFIDGYIMLPLFFLFWFCYDLFYFKSGFVKLHEMDFETGRRRDLDDEQPLVMDDKTDIEIDNFDDQAKQDHLRFKVE